METYLGAILLAAALQSFGKLALLPRKWEFLTAALLIPLPFLFEKRLAGASLAAFRESLSDARTLENGCALVVIQELSLLLAGLSLLTEYETNERIHRWKFAAFLPSVLLPAGVLYLQSILFNTLVEWNFRSISILLAIAAPASGILTTECVRLLRRNREERILSILHFEWLLVLPAIFFPVAAGARLIPVSPDESPSPLPALGMLAIPVIAGAIIVPIYHYICKRKQS